ncbi:trypsin-like serine protease [Bradyrhizobium sp. 200]|uniref:trypsin-like serine peptidase n=1 Tax=Bradyrhizobium sp. 200 TaxID=2782665 RepID=UPI001FFEBF82|nr:trypsin-like serine protease [Bradyrhizobium sp. 200]UPJ50506.1 trypsin-like serine protease [Bradyrhizobium sp. 200]
MITSQTLAVLGGLVVLLPVAFAGLPSGINLHLAVQHDDASLSGTEIDHRRIVDVRLSPYSAIGKFKGTMTCTAAIVLNPRIIITAGHCVNERDGTTRQSNLSFNLGYQTGADLGQFQATVWAVGSKQSVSHESVRDASRDWAILILDRAPANVQPLLLSHRSLRAEELFERQVLLPVYSNDIGNAEGLSVDPACTVRDLVWDTLVHTCMARPGSSGAPLLLRDGSGYALIGIHTASIFASDSDGHIGKFVGNQAVASWMFSEAALRLAGKLDNGPAQTINSGDY